MSVLAAWVTNASRKASMRLRAIVQARGGAVAAVAEQVVRAGGEAGEEVEARDRAAGAGALVAVERDQHGRAVVALGDAGGDDPDHARVPALGGEDVRGGAGGALLAEQRLGLEADARLDVAALGVTVSSSAAICAARGRGRG